jgi:ABC-type uncharacterized transport system permease subunit
MIVNSSTIKIVSPLNHYTCFSMIERALIQTSAIPQYLVSIIALAGFIGNARPHKAIGKPYSEEEEE